MTTPADWYPDPHDAGQLRYWDGVNWTEHVAVAGTVPQEEVHPAVPPTAPLPGTGMPNYLKSSTLFAQVEFRSPRFRISNWMKSRILSSGQEATRDSRPPFFGRRPGVIP